MIFKKYLKKVKSQYHYYRSDFYKFEKSIHPDSYRITRALMNWAEENTHNPDIPNDSQGAVLRDDLMTSFKEKYKSSALRILVHIPEQKASPAGFSLFHNFIESAEFLGLSVKGLNWADDTKSILDEFKPNVLLTSDSENWLSRIDWETISNYRQKHPLAIGLTASVEEENKIPIINRLEWARKHGVSFFYCYDNNKYLEERVSSYEPFYNAGYAIHTYEYTFNPLKFYPVQGYERDINFLMMGSGYNNSDKRQLYIDWFGKIWQDYPGFIYGPGWRNIPFKGIDSDRDRLLYSRGKVGLNLSIPRQLKWHASLNERAYILAACGIPQLSDRALLFTDRFSDDEVFFADNPVEYYEKFEYILSHPDEAMKAALKAQRKVFQHFTNFHSVESFIRQIEKSIEV
jgi:hypothetical protein